MDDSFGTTCAKAMEGWYKGNCLNSGSWPMPVKRENGNIIVAKNVKDSICTDRYVYQ